MGREENWSGDPVFPNHLPHPPCLLFYVHSTDRIGKHVPIKCFIVRVRREAPFSRIREKVSLGAFPRRRYPGFFFSPENEALQNENEESIDVPVGRELKMRGKQEEAYSMEFLEYQSLPSMFGNTKSGMLML
ncbi:hypothetical protein CEXT_351371 [Caerostris extrusa]|uniref:Uncharacterized protein n=1 Tax=Caerostris extrusa TaxID=172846 RepID=A0AAV4RQ11_CAEEX|nr:hypothetical protein CEXT_351371 [Caerostris extrusa]